MFHTPWPDHGRGWNPSLPPCAPFPRRFLGSFVFRSDLLTGHESARTRDDDEDEDEKRGQLPPVPHPASRTPHSEGSWRVSCSVRTYSPAMNRRVVGTAGIPAGVLRADCHAGKDADAPRFMGSEHLQIWT